MADQAMLDELAARRCAQPPAVVSRKEVARYLYALPGWRLEGDGIRKTFNFDDFDQTIAFVNGIAAVAREQNHHPDLNVSYNKCGVMYCTHSARGLTDSDFICAAKVEKLGRTATSDE